MDAVLDSEKSQFTLDSDYLIHRVDTSTDCENHTHEFAELVYVFSGKAIHYVDHIRYTLQKGDLLFINYGCNHAVSHQPHSVYADIMLKPEFLNAELRGKENAFSLFDLEEFNAFLSTVNQKRHLIHFSPEDCKPVETLIEMTLDEQKNENVAASLVKRSALNMLLTLIYRKMAEVAEQKFSINEALLTYIRENCHEKLTVKSLSRMCFYTEAHFSRAFKKYTTKTFTKYLNDCRLQKAELLLSGTQKTVEEIFLECGFSNRTHFFQCFFAKTGMTPLQYRKNQNMVLF